MLAFAQLTGRESLRDIEASLSAQSAKLYHMGIRWPVRRSTLADTNERRDWRIHAEFAQRLIAQARALHADEDLGLELDNTVYALDSSTIDLCLSVFPWALFRTTKSGIKPHTLLDLRGSIPAFTHVSHAKMGDVKALDLLIPEPGAFYIMDRAYLDFTRLNTVHMMGAFFVTRAKSNTKFRRRYSRPVDRSASLPCDQTVGLTGVKTRDSYPQPLRRVKYRDPETGRTFNFLTNNFAVPALTVAELYRCRWQVELFFKWIKQHLRIKSFFGTSENAVKTQIWVAVSVCVLAAIVKKRLGLEVSLYTFLRVLSVTLFEKTQLNQGLFDNPLTTKPHGHPNQCVAHSLDTHGNCALHAELCFEPKIQSSHGWLAQKADCSSVLAQAVCLRRMQILASLTHREVDIATSSCRSCENCGPRMTLIFLARFSRLRTSFLPLS